MGREQEPSTPGKAALGHWKEEERDNPGSKNLQKTPPDTVLGGSGQILAEMSPPACGSRAHLDKD